MRISFNVPDAILARLWTAYELEPGEITVPSSAPYEVTLDSAKLQGNGANVNVVLKDGATVYDQVASVGAVSAGEFHVDSGTGVATFHSSNADTALTVFYEDDIDQRIRRQTRKRTRDVTVSNSLRTTKTSEESTFDGDWAP